MYRVTWKHFEWHVWSYCYYFAKSVLASALYLKVL